jgi:ferrous iron transport protein A
MLNLSQWAENQSSNNTAATCVVELFQGPESLQERLREMGIYSGLVLKVKGRAPWKGPWLVEYSETVMALREEEAQCLIVKSV